MNNAPAILTAPLTDQMTYARALSASGMLPRQYQGKPENLLYAIGYAEMLGCHPLTAVTGIHVIDGKPSASAALISALVRKAGHKLRVTGTTTSATAQIIRADDPDFTFEVTFTIDDAKAAGLVGKGVWKSYPASMLKARAITQCARDACEDALSGIHYTAEELGADVDEEGAPLAAPMTAEEFTEKHGGDLVASTLKNAKAERGVPLDDPWATVEVAQPPAATDTDWFAGWHDRVMASDSLGVLRGLHGEMVEQHKTRKLTDEDRAEAEAAVVVARERIEVVQQDDAAATEDQLNLDDAKAHA